MASLIPKSQSGSLHQLTRTDDPLFWHLWLPHRAYLYRCCLGWMNYNSIHAEEALNDSMLKAHRKFPQYEHKIINAKGWLRQICYRTCLDLKRKIKIETTWNDKLAEHHPLENNLTIKRETSQEFVIIVNDAFATLPPSLRQPLVLRIHEGQSYEQISQHLSISVCNARKRVQLGRKKLKKHLAVFYKNITMN
ncbi:MAG: RNA polymerase sigma factor [Microcystaceae cyanobacterium]